MPLNKNSGAHFTKVLLSLSFPIKLLSAPHDASIMSSDLTHSLPLRKCALLNESGTTMDAGEPIGVHHVASD
jgi:hypothetical protein